MEARNTTQAEVAAQRVSGIFGVRRGEKIAGGRRRADRAANQVTRLGQAGGACLRGGSARREGAAALVSADAAWHKADVSQSDDAQQGSPAAENAYWNRFYSEAHQELQAPSSFAVHVSDTLGLVRPDLRLFELGCGNGRDALFFASRGVRVTACDRSEVAVQTLQARPDLEDRGRFPHKPEFLAADFLELGAAYRGPAPDLVYSRFTLHAVPAPVQSAALGWARRALAPGGKLLVEVRSVNGSLYGKGQEVERDAFIHDGHYRRFVRMEELTSELMVLGFGIDSASEASGVAVYKDDDPVVIRLVASLAA